MDSSTQTERTRVKRLPNRGAYDRETIYAILDEVWDGETDLRSNVIDVYLASIRGKIDKPFGTSTITTVRGAGYRLDRPGDPGPS